MLTVTNISAACAKTIKYLSTEDVLISINEPDSPLKELRIDRQLSRVLTVSFWDITAKLNYQNQLLEPINGQTALDIIEFVRRWKRKNFIVHCHAGLSRSAAVAVFIHLIYGHKLKGDFWRVSKPNPYVLGKLMLLHAQVPEVKEKKI